MAVAEKELERLVVRLIGDAESYQKMLAEARSSMSKTDQEVSRSVKNIEQNTKVLTQAAAFSIMMVGQDLAQMFGNFSRQIVASSAAYEQTTVSFGAMLGSATLAQSTLNDLVQFAAKTPFEMPTLEAASKMLLQYGVSVNEVLPILKSIGDVTGGADPNKVMMMSYAFGQMRAAGRLMGQDLLQMINAGFNPLREIAKVTGKSVSDLKMEMEKGRVTADMVSKAFEAASKRLNLMEKQSVTLSGRMSTLRDNYGIFLRHIGDETAPVVNFAVDRLAELVAKMDTLGSTTKATVGIMAYMGSGLGTVIQSVGMFTFAASSLLTGLRALLPILASVGAALLSISGGWIVVGIVAVGAAVWALARALIGTSKPSADAAKRVEKLKKETEAYNKETKNLIDELKYVSTETPALAGEIGGEMLKKSQKEVSDLKEHIKGLTETLKIAAGPTIGSINRELERLKAKLGAAEARAKGLENTVDMLPKPINAFEDALRKLREESDKMAMAGKTPWEKFYEGVLEATSKAGRSLTREQWGTLYEEFSTAQAARDLDEYVKIAEKFREGVEKSRLMLGKTEEEVALIQMAKAAKGSLIKESLYQEANAAYENFKENERLFKLRQEAAEIIKESTPATEKFASVKAKLDRDLEKGNITQVEYNALLNDTRKKLLGVAKQAEDTRNSIMGLTSMAWGSAEHLAELRDLSIYASRMEGPSRPPPNARWSGPTGAPLPSPVSFEPPDPKAISWFFENLAAQPRHRSEIKLPTRPALVRPEATLPTPTTETPAAEYNDFIRKRASEFDTADTTELLQRLVVVAEKYWKNTTGITLEPAGLV